MPKLPTAKIVISQDKLVDLLLHAATREDIAELRNDMNSRLEHMDSRFEALRSDVSNRFDKLMFLVVGALLIPIALFFLERII